MSFGFSADQEQFRDVVARFMADKSSPETVRHWMADESGFDQTVWAQLGGELGLLGTHLPEAYGGFGFGPIEQGIISQEMGRHLYGGPYLSSAVMAGYALLQVAGEADKLRLLPGLATGDTIATLVLDDLGNPDRLGHALTVTDAGLTGTASKVIDAQAASVLLVAARSADGLGLYEVDPANARITPLDALDPTRKLAQVTFDAAPVTSLGSINAEQLQRLWDQCSSALAHEMIGGAQRLFETTIEYLKIRVQFGRTIGSFQGLKHRCADLLLELEHAKAMTHAAARYLADGEGDAYAPNMAKAMASDAYISLAKQAIQLRGGIGFTWEEDTHLWYKRAKSSEVLFGTSNWHRERMMQRMLNEDTEKEPAHV